MPADSLGVWTRLPLEPQQGHEVQLSRARLLKARQPGGPLRYHPQGGEREKRAEPLPGLRVHEKADPDRWRQTPTVPNSVCDPHHTPLGSLGGAGTQGYKEICSSPSQRVPGRHLPQR